MNFLYVKIMAHSQLLNVVITGKSKVVQKKFFLWPSYVGPNKKIHAM